MKNYLKNLTLVASILLACTTFAQEVLPASAISAISSVPATSQSPVNNTVQENKDFNELQAYAEILTALAPVINPYGNIEARINRLIQLEFSTEAKKIFLDLFGNENPLHIDNRKVGNGNTMLSFILDKLDYRDPKSATSVQSLTLTGHVVFNKQFTKQHATASMPSFDYDNGKTRFAANDFSYIADQTHGSPRLWFGTSSYKLGHLELDNKTPEMHLKLDGISIKESSKKHGEKVDFDIETAIKSINWGGDGAGSAHMAIRFANIDVTRLAKITDREEENKLAKLTKEERLAANSSISKEFELAMLDRGAAIEIKDLSIKYHEMTAGLNGRISLENMLISDFESPRLIKEKIFAHINVHIPMTLIHLISREFVRNNLEQQRVKNMILNVDSPPVTDEMVTKVEKELSDKFMNKLLSEKWVHVQHDILLSTFEIKQGRMSINGHAFSFPDTK